jgi:hypothetical protein
MEVAEKVFLFFIHFLGTTFTLCTEKIHDVIASMPHVIAKMHDQSSDNGKNQEANGL